MSRRDGYVVDVTYPLHFYKEMQPLWLNYVLNTLGCVTPTKKRDRRHARGSWSTKLVIR